MKSGTSISGMKVVVCIRVFLSLCCPDSSILAGVGWGVKPDVRDVRHCEAEYGGFVADSGEGVPAASRLSGAPAGQEADGDGDGRPEAPHHAHPPTSSRTRGSVARVRRTSKPAHVSAASRSPRSARPPS